MPKLRTPTFESLDQVPADLQVEWSHGSLFGSCGGRDVISNLAEARHVIELPPRSPAGRAGLVKVMAECPDCGKPLVPVCYMKKESA